MKKYYRFPKGYKVKINNSWHTIANDGEEFLHQSVKSWKTNQGISYPFSPSRLTIAELKNIGINTVNDEGYDTAKYDLNGTPTEVVETDLSITKIYPQATMEKKAGYLKSRKDSKKQDCLISLERKLSEGLDITTIEPNIKVKVDRNSVLDLLTLLDSGVSAQRKFEDYNGDVKILSEADIASIKMAACMYYSKINDRKNAHFISIDSAKTDVELDAITSFDWAV